MSDPDPWRVFVGALEGARDIIESSPDDELTRAEGQRHLFRLMGMGLETTLERGDPARPVLSHKLFCGGDTSDCRYLDAHIDGRYRYRIHGERGSAPLIEFTIYDGKVGRDPQSAQLAFLTEENLVVDERGCLDVVLSAERGDARNWLETPANARYLMVRQYAHDWSATRPASLQIHAVPAAPRAEPLDAEAIAAGLRGATDFAIAVVERWRAVVEGIRRAPVNTLVQVPVSVGALSLPGGHRFATGHFGLAEAEALSIRFKPPKAPYWGLQLTNYWFEPIDYGGTGSHLNNRTAVAESDGSVELLISPKDPGHPNWLDPKGHAHGTMQFRSSRGGDDAIPEFEITLHRR
jgi:hypothetical protein